MTDPASRASAILVATDLTDAATPSIARAGQLARAHGAALRLVHVLDAEWWLAVRDLVQQMDLQHAVREQCRLMLDAAVALLAAQGHVQVQTELREGPVLQELAEAAQQADLLVIGAGGRHKLREAALGSTASRLARVVRRPLLVVHGADARPYERVLVATDLSDAAAAALDAVARLLPQAGLHVVHCFDLAYEGRLRLAGVSDAQLADYRQQGQVAATRALRAWATRVLGNRPVHLEVREGDARFALLAAAHDLDAQLVVVGKQGRSFVSETLLGSVTSWLLEEAGRDVLVVPGRRD